MKYNMFDTAEFMLEEYELRKDKDEFILDSNKKQIRLTKWREDKII